MTRTTALIVAVAVLSFSGTVAGTAAAQATPLTRQIACPIGMTCSPRAIDASGRQLVYLVRPASQIGEQLLVHDTVTAQDRSVAVLPSGEFSNIAITDNGRYILYYDGSTFTAFGTSPSTVDHAYDTATGSTVDLSVVVVNGVSYFPTAGSRDLRYLLYSVYQAGLGSRITRLLVYDRQLAVAAEIPLAGRAPLLGATLSPDGRYITYGSAVPPYNQWIVDRFTGQEAMLSEPRGSLAMFTSDSQYLIRAGASFDRATGRLVVRAPEGAVSPSGQYIAYRCSEDPRDATFCVYDQTTTLTSRVPSLDGPQLVNGIFGGAVVDDLGRVAFYNLTAEGDIYQSCGSLFVPAPKIMSTNLAVTSTLRLTVSSDACGWTAQSNAPWITITSPTSGAGSTELSYVVAANASGKSRTGTITVAGQTFAVTQGQSLNAAPGAPVALRADHDSFSSLIWNAPVDGGAVTNYIIEGGSRPGASDYFRVATADATTSVPLNVTMQVRLYLRVRSANQFGESIASNEVAFNVGTGNGLPCIRPPDAPVNLNATVAGSTATLGWTGWLPFANASYAIEVGSASGLSNLANYIPGNTVPSVVVPGVAAGSYFARVRAIDQCGEGPPSNEIVLTVSE